MSKEIRTNKDDIILVDDEDYEWASKFFWYSVDRPASNTTYARTFITMYGKRSRFYLHQLVIDHMYGYDDETDLEIDHKNRIGLDNRRSNLRLIDHNLNIHNSANRKGTSSKYRGVRSNTCDTCRGKPWRAYIRTRTKLYHLGVFDDEKDAARAYNKRALAIYGSDVVLNKL